MKVTLKSIAGLLSKEISTSGDIRYLRVNSIYVITENPFSKKLEINNLETYESQDLNIQQLSDLVELTFIHQFRSERSVNPQLILDQLYKSHPLADKVD